jgi:DNA helicase II / ATP-dependent DNA helicase PcrA
VTVDEFLALIARTRGIGRVPNLEQEACIRSDPGRPNMIVAGPGTGKTTVLVLRALRHIAVDRVAPDGIVITTFTKKAAREIRSRLIEWGESFLEEARATAPTDDRAFLSLVDVNRIVTGTLDSICQEALGSDRHADEPPLVTLEGFAAGVLLRRRGRLSEVWGNNRTELDPFLAPFTLDRTPPRTVGEAAATLVPIIDRFVHDLVDVAGFGAPDQPAAQQLIAGVAENYRTYLRDNNLLDFAGLEEALLNRLHTRNVPALLAPASAVLVDEYQDTNAMQEAIYFELVLVTGASFTVVGDDDQSLYRFRGATIELFREFVGRCRRHLSIEPHAPLYLVENYRSTEEIVEFFNAYVRQDPNFLPARIQPPKPDINSTLGPSGVPVLAMFRPDRPTLAGHLAGFLHDVFRGNGFRDANGRLPEPLRRATEGGDLGDAVLLGHTVEEIQRPYFNNPPEPRFAHHFRRAMAALDMQIFNPRGRSLRDVPQVEQILGLALLAIDPPARPGGPLFEAMPITNEAKFFMRRWIAAAEAFIASGPPEIYRRLLHDELSAWQAYSLDGTGEKSTSRDWPFLDVLYGFVPWLPFFEDDPEGQVYLEAITRAAGQASGFSAFGGKLVRPVTARGEADSGRRSVGSLLFDVIAPIAESEIEVDEEIMPSVPRDRLNVMTIHQAKGLEYPLVIVDIGAAFSSNSEKNRFRRFPEHPSSTALEEDLLAPFTGELGPLRRQRGPLDRTFEDLIRLYYVAFSRPQSVLMLVGCDKMLRWRSNIKHVATGWRQDWTWSWRDASPQPTGRRLPTSVRPPAIHFV